MIESRALLQQGVFSVADAGRLDHFDWKFEMKLVLIQPAILRIGTTLAVSVICVFIASGAGLSTQDRPLKQTDAQNEQEVNGNPTSDKVQEKADHEDSANAGGDSDGVVNNAPQSVEEARIRAKILHEAFGGALQVMHRDFFREDQKLKLPSQSLEDVFAEMARSQKVELRWLAVNANAMSVNHKPQNEFEKKAVAALSSGKQEFESVNEDSFQFVGSIRLSASCVKCHVRNRTSNDERKAGLVIKMPLTLTGKSQIPGKN